MIIEWYMNSAQNKSSCQRKKGRTASACRSQRGGPAVRVLDLAGCKKLVRKLVHRL